MDMLDPDIASIAHQLNERAHSHPIGELQAIRKHLRRLGRRAGSDIFTSQTINEEWAFHHGGRSELQFNIGKEYSFGGTELRHGVAFSFELSQTLPSIDVLVPRVRLFNDYMREHADAFADMRMWHHQHGRDSPTGPYAPRPIVPELVSVGTFVFLGNRQLVNGIDCERILGDFDRLLPLYVYVQRDDAHEAPAPLAPEGFQFRPGFTDKSEATTATLAERELNISLKHNILQATLCRRLISEYGPENVGDEQSSVLGTKIDVVVRHSHEEFWYYEIKTALSPRACLREAFGQLMEYAYWPGACEARRLIVCGESPLDDDGKAYLQQLKNRFSLPIEYEQISL